MQASPIRRGCLSAALIIGCLAGSSPGGEENPVAPKPYGAQKRTVYHVYLCGMGKQIPDKNRIEFDTIEDAEKSGRRLCGFCRNIAEKQGRQIKTGVKSGEEGAAPPKPKEPPTDAAGPKKNGGKSAGESKKPRRQKDRGTGPPGASSESESTAGDRGDDPQPEVSSGRFVGMLSCGTIVVESGQKVRLLGIAFPETDQPLSENAVRFAVEQMRDRTLYFSYSRFAPAPEHRDALGRLLAYVKPDQDGRDLAGELLFQGYAALDRTIAFDRRAEYERRELDAFSAKRGLWKPLEGKAGRVKVVVGDHAHCYHRKDCPHVEHLTDAREVTINQAKARRLAPCSEFRTP